MSGALRRRRARRAARSKRPTSSSSAPAPAAARRRACSPPSGARVVVLEEGPRLAPASSASPRARRWQSPVPQPGQAGGVRPRDDADPAGALRRRHHVRQLGDRVAAAAEGAARWHSEFGLADGMPAGGARRGGGAHRGRAVGAPGRRGRQRATSRICCLRDGAAGARHRTGASSIATRRAAAARGAACTAARTRPSSRRRSRRCGAPSPTAAYVVADARVDRIERDGGRAVAVRGHFSGDGPERGQRFRVAARRAVIVAGGAIQSSNLLWRSGVRSRASRPALHGASGHGAAWALYPARVDALDRRLAGLRGVRPARHARREVRVDQRAARGDGGAPARRRRALRRAARPSCPTSPTGRWRSRPRRKGAIRPSLLFGDYVRYDLTRERSRAAAHGHAHAGRDALRRRRARGRHRRRRAARDAAPRPTSWRCSTRRRSTRAPTAWS